MFLTFCNCESCVVLVSQVDGEEIVPNNFQPNDRVTVSLSGAYAIVTTDFDLQVGFNGNHYVYVKVPDTYRGMTS